MIGQQELSETGRPLRISVSLDADLHEFVQRAALARHQTMSATVRGLLAELALARNAGRGAAA